MSYISSKNLINEPDLYQYTHTGFRLQSYKDANIKRQYCCPFCKKLYKTNPFIKRQNPITNKPEYQCKHCGTILSNIEPIIGHFTLGNLKHPDVYLYQFDTVQTIIIGQQYDDTDGHLIAVNATIFYQKHAVSLTPDTVPQTYIQKYNSYIKKQRIIFNIDQNQIYYVDKYGTAKGQTFLHYTLKGAYFSSEQSNNPYMCEILIRKIIEIIYDNAYHYTFVSSVAKMKALSIDQGFYLMKFPIVANHAWITDISDASPHMFALFHWLSNYDRKLRAMITCRDFTEYKRLWGKYFAKTFHEYDISDILHTHTPWFLLTAWQMSHMGFHNLNNVSQIEECIMQTKLNDYDTPVPLLLLFTKRSHSLNKLFRRLIKTHGEHSVTQMILHSKFHTSYSDYVYRFRSKIINKIQNIDFASADFSQPLDTFIDVRNTNP